MAQSQIKLRPMLVSTAIFRKLVQKGALCSICNMAVNTHGGQVPCYGGSVVVSDLVRVLLKGQNVSA